MYFPYFRGKQYELIAIRESSQIFSQAGFIPVIEPVKEAMGGIEKALDQLIEAKGSAIVIINPDYGVHKRNGNAIAELITEKYSENSEISFGLLLNEYISSDEAHKFLEDYGARISTLIHAGFTKAKVLSEYLSENGLEFRHLFLEESCGKLYQKHFREWERILIRDGFEKRTNRSHPETEFFSDLHATFKEEGMDGFGDFLMVGDEYSESGGPAYAVAIHLTYIDHGKDDEMHIHHFKSIRQDDPKDPAGKFLEALEKLVQEINTKDTQLFISSAIDEFLDLHKRGHFPGLGYVKKLSMKHHIETLAHYFST